MTPTQTPPNNGGDKDYEDVPLYPTETVQPAAPDEAPESEPAPDEAG